MESIESLQLTLSKHEESRRLVSAALLKANEQLVSAKFLQRGRLKDSIKNYEQELKRLDKLIKETNDTIAKLQKSDDKRDTKITAYEHGIDANKAWSDAISSGLGSVSSAITGIVNPLAAGTTPKQVLKGSEAVAPSDAFVGSPAEKKPLDGVVMYVVIGAILLFMLLKKK